MKVELIPMCINPSDGPKEAPKFSVKSQEDDMPVKVLSLLNVVQKF